METCSHRKLATTHRITPFPLHWPEWSSAHFLSHTDTLEGSRFRGDPDSRSILLFFGFCWREYSSLLEPQTNYSSSQIFQLHHITFVNFGSKSTKTYYVLLLCMSGIVWTDSWQNIIMLTLTMHSSSTYFNSLDTKVAKLRQGTLLILMCHCYRYDHSFCYYFTQGDGGSSLHSI